MSEATPAKPKREKKAPSKRGGRRSNAGRKRTKPSAVVSLGTEVAALVDALVGGAGGMVLTRLLIELAVGPKTGTSGPDVSVRNPDPVPGDLAT